MVVTILGLCYYIRIIKILWLLLLLLYYDIMVVTILGLCYYIMVVTILGLCSSCCVILH